MVIGHKLRRDRLAACRSNLQGAGFKNEVANGQNQTIIADQDAAARALGPKNWRSPGIDGN